MSIFQILYNAVWELPTERVEEAVVAVLPVPTYVLPREKPAPKPKPLTKWEQYAKDKGLSSILTEQSTNEESSNEKIPLVGKS